MSFNKIEIVEWQQFQKIDIEFHEKVTIITGANGCGKTTILNLLARHASWPIGSLATPKKTNKLQPYNFLTRLWNGKDRSLESVIGSITYDDGKVSL